MRRPSPLLGVFAVLFSLSCSFVGPLPPTPVLEPSPIERLPAVSGPHRPSAVDWIAARFLTYQTGLSRAEVDAVSRTIVARSAELRLEWPLILAVIKIESGFHNFARSRVGALGLMQVMPETGEMLAGELGVPWAGPSTLFDPVVNVKMGTRYLRQLHARFGSWDRALAAYNWGPGAIGQRLRTGRAVPAGYATKVLAQRQTEQLF